MLKLNMIDSHIKVQSVYINMRMIVYKVDIVFDMCHRLNSLCVSVTRIDLGGSRR